MMAFIPSSSDSDQLSTVMICLNTVETTLNTLFIVEVFTLRV
jgi:hypothetical protein